MFYLSEAEELLNTIWSVYAYKDLSVKKFHLRFGEKGQCLCFEFKTNFDCTPKSKVIKKYKWIMQDTGTIEVLDAKTEEQVFVFSKDT